MPSIPRVSFAFFAIAALCGVAGMVWGLWMGAAGDHGTYPAHAHLNLVGWLTPAAMGAFYAVAGAGVPRLLARANLLLSGAGGIVLPAGIAGIALGQRGAVPLAIAGGMLALAGMAVFLSAVLIAWGRRPRIG